MEKQVFASNSSNKPAFNFSRRFLVEGVALPSSSFWAVEYNEDAHFLRPV